ncbi:MULTISPECIES: acyl-CoA dehydrogenase family protein [unclassified Actinopolyspora]|uniref:acyl-CoA dehydrogenase family protein n=1 Tax=unclassified Actinopolyspora TaxID=2639451 RepID=UPI001A97EC05|nr:MULTISPECIES: acyl-CoA dehydrogenase family protein [unclassified Actinopolyspora]
MQAISGLLFAAPALGAARGALREWSRQISRTSSSGQSRAEQPAVQTVAARSASEVDAAELLLSRVGHVVDRGDPTHEELLRGAYDCAVATDLLVGVVERLFRAAGSRGQLCSSALQRFWRDVHCLSSHVALQLEPSGIAYGSHLLRAYRPE